MHPSVPLFKHVWLSALLSLSIKKQMLTNYSTLALVTRRYAVFARAVHFNSLCVSSQFLKKICFESFPGKLVTRLPRIPTVPNKRAYIAVPLQCTSPNAGDELNFISCIAALALRRRYLQI